MVERSLSMREVPGSIPGASKTFSSTLCLPNFKKKFASSGNRTRAARVAGEHSTTEPTMHISERAKFCNDISPCEEMFDTEKNVLAVGRIRTYAPRGKLISSQSP